MAQTHLPLIRRLLLASICAAAFYFIFIAENPVSRFLHHEYIPTEANVRKTRPELILPGAQRIEGLFGFGDVGCIIFSYELPEDVSLAEARRQLSQSMQVANWKLSSKGPDRLDWLYERDSLANHARIVFRPADRKVFCCVVFEGGPIGTQSTFAGTTGERYAKDSLWPRLERFTQETEKQ